MKDNLFIVLALLLLYVPSCLFGQKEEAGDVSEKLVSYIVIKGDKLKNVAVRFQVSPHTLMKANKLKSKNTTAYPGMILQIPVKVRPQAWDPTREGLSDNGLLNEDRRPSADYEVIADGFDYDIKDDFIRVSDVIDDSIQYEKTATHMAKIDKRISYMTYRIDSVKQAEFSGYNDKDINSVLGRMQMARDKYYMNGPLGREIDSLTKVKTKLADLRIGLRAKITEYEYLRDNHEYFKENYERDELNKDTHWGDQITYESNYQRSKEKHDALLQKTDTVPKPPVDTVKVQPKPIVKDSIIPTPDKVATPPPVALVPERPVSTSQAIAPEATNIRTGMSHRKVDFSTLAVKTAPIEISNTDRTLSLPASAGNIEKTSSIAIKSDVYVIDNTNRKEENPNSQISKIDTAAQALSPFRASHNTTSIDTPGQVAPPIATTTAAKDSFIKISDIATQVNVTDIVPPTIATKDTIGKSPFAGDTNNMRDTNINTPSATYSKDATAKGIITLQNIKSNETIKKADSAIANTYSPKTIGTNKNNTNTHIDGAHSAIAVLPKSSVSKATVITSTTKAANVDNTIPAKVNPATSAASQTASIKSAKDNSHKSMPGKTSTGKKDMDKQVTSPKDATITKNTIAPTTAETIALREQVKPVTASYLYTPIPVNDGPLLTLDTKYDSTMLYREKKVNTDPLASYKTDSNFVITNVQLKEIPIVEIKNKPKYLIPVDSVSRIKGEFYLIRARQVLEQGDFKDGDKFLRKSLDLNPNNAATWMLHADLCLTTGAVDKALTEYTISGEIDSTNPKVFYNIALLYAKANDEQKAYKYFSRATDVNEKYLLAYMGRASVLMDQRDYEGAILDYDKALSINKYYSPAYKGRALAKMELRKFPDAVTDFNQYLEIEDPDGYVIYERGIAKILSNNLLQGCLDLSSALELGYKDAEKAIKKFCE